MSVPAFLEYSYNSGCVECGVAGWEHAANCSQRLPEYHCCYCGGTFEATPSDVEDARAAARETAEDEGKPEVAAVSDAEAFREFGRDVCPACIPTFKQEQEDRRPPEFKRAPRGLPL